MAKKRVIPLIPHMTDSPHWGICLMGNVPRHIPQWTEIGDLEHIYTFFVIFIFVAKIFIKVIIIFNNKYVLD